MGAVRGAPVGSESKSNGTENHMLYTLAVVLIVLWALGLVTSYTMGGFIHVLLVLADHHGPGQRHSAAGRAGVIKRLTEGKETGGSE
jgi:hypothetical protein